MAGGRCPGCGFEARFDLASAAGQALAIPGAAVAPASGVALGQTVSLGRGGAGTKSLRYGWAAVENWGVWSVQEWASLDCAVDCAAADRLRFELWLRAVQPRDRILPLRVDLYGQERFLGSHVIAERGDVTLSGRFLLNAGSCSKVFTLEFHSAVLRSPASLGAGQGETAFGVGLVAVRFQRDG